MIRYILLMIVRSYQHHLNLINQKPRSSIFKKILVFNLLLFLAILGFVSAFYYWQFKKEAPLRARIHYLEVASGGFTASKQSLDETLTTFQIAGAKIRTVDNL